MTDRRLIFETSRLSVRQYDLEKDAENFFLLNGDEEVMRYIRKPKKREECDAFLKEVIAAYEDKPLMGRWAVNEKQSGKFVGSFAFIPVEKTEDSQLGYALLKEYWGKGFATEAIALVVEYAFRRLNLHKLTAGCYSNNIASVKAFKHAGFIEEGLLRRQYYCDGEYVDAICLGVLKEE